MNLLGYLDYLRLKSEYKKCTLSTEGKFTICHSKKNELGGLLFYECEFRTKQAKNIFGQEHISPFQAVLATACAGSAGICLYDYFFLSPYVWHHIGVSGLQGFHRFFSQQVGGPKKL